MKTWINCQVCKKLFYPKHKNQRNCSQECYHTIKGWSRRQKMAKRGGANTTCLRCDSPFKSADPKVIRICPGCKNEETWQEASRFAEAWG